LGSTATDMSLPPHLVPFWSDYAKTTSAAIEERFYEAFSFGDSEELANDLAALVLRGTKRATAGALWSYEAEGKRLPRPGDLSIVTDWSGQPLCVIETLSVEVVPFNEVTADFAATEGEGDGSLSFWRGAHRAYFTRECVSVGREFLENMLISCERFAVVYRPSTSAAQAPSHRGPFR
ncbi:MAG: ASCH domain-containing protein, partial [Rhodocyclaceae bacterium]|nr:ASCH domain-containing protein [Rhodocyclaceae bacterium]